MRYIMYIGIVLLGVFSQSCAKFLDEKPQLSAATPDKEEDLRALLDFESQINLYYPGLIELGTDDYYLTDVDYGKMQASYQEAYTWDKNMLSIDVGYWRTCYNTIMISNIVLEGVERLQPVKNIDIQGEAMFVRGLAHFYVAQLYCPVFDKDTDSPYGVPIRLTSDFNVPVTRATVHETYQQIIEDIKGAIPFLKDQAAEINRPSKRAAYAALARIYLSMLDYESARYYANQCLKVNADLMDFNAIDPAPAFPFNPKNVEMIYYGSTISGSSALHNGTARIPKPLYDLYDGDDLRKQVYFKSINDTEYAYKGYYSGRSASYFAGFANDELYLIRAECNARLGARAEAVADLNKLLENRIVKGAFEALKPLDAKELLSIILNERRKEMLFRGVRWSDLKRLNLDPDHAVDLFREINVNGEIKRYELPANDPRYIYPIPAEVIIQSNILQNPR
ncbi:RagB/SusD family nutrient uptake outer membrane protein [Sphingobacterium sp. N143]|uniref:RagB/SusD family nutrient uptake outer membrane protein n=1 Tax=Sphingobacterium sp. N143 TaxID=2746727 RepID=UPI0025757A03|nr:RagB/SusD family nutrient uptake outer membrane protein [Sphingobacterium sp. N143]MDM1295295.1 RagB/SusD family nutrient uptake outer membrane protein [Sphingobacterium sp. N143]